MKSLVSLLVIYAFLVLSPVVLAAETGTVSGTVAEVIDSGGYVYMRLEDGLWVAANSFIVSKGDNIQYGGANEMNGFYSKSLCIH